MNARRRQGLLQQCTVYEINLCPLSCKVREERSQLPGPTQGLFGTGSPSLLCNRVDIAPGAIRAGQCKEPVPERAFWSAVTTNPPLYGADTPTSFFDDRLPFGWNLRDLQVRSLIQNLLLLHRCS